MSRGRLSRFQRSSIVGGAVGASLVGLYLYQPQRIDFFPRPVPDPNPAVDPDSHQLFSPGVRVAVVSAHPDDTEFYLGGTLSRLHRSGAKILLIVCTDGDKGYYPWFLTDANENRRVRRIEQVAAAKTYAADVVFLARPDGRLRADDALVAEVRLHLAEFAPEYVFSFDPIYPPRIQHSDHLQSGIAAERASQGISSIRWHIDYSTHAPNFYVDVSKFWNVKEATLAKHKSQFSGARLGQIERMLRSWAHRDGRAIGVEFAESFRAIRSTDGSP
jgi:LmbE family N-acetylglucosaminyl deacetylase